MLTVIYLQVMSTATASRPRVSTSDLSSQARESYKQAYRIVTEALSCDETRDIPRAHQLYLRAKQLLQTASAMATERDLISKIRSLLENVNSRLRDFDSQLRTQPVSSNANYSENPPSYDEAIKDRPSSVKSIKTPNSANIIISIDKVNLYHVLESGEIKSQTPDSLSLCEFNQKVKGQPPVFICCGSWVTPIVPDETVVYVPTSFLYMFPDPRTYDPDSHLSHTFTGVVLDSSISQKQRKQFQFSIESLCVVKEGVLRTPNANLNSEEPIQANSASEEGSQGWGEWLSDKVTTGSSYLSSMIAKGGDKGDELIAEGGDKIRGSIDPASKDVSVHPAVENGLLVGKKVTGAAVTVGDFVLTNLAKLTWSAGEHVYHYVSQTDAAKNCGENENAKQALTLTKSTARSGGSIYLSASDAAKKLLLKTKSEVVGTVEHKYGEPAGKVADRSIGITTDSVDLISYFNWKTLAVKFAAKTLGQGANKLNESEEKGKTIESK